jgi:NADPH:quinone reductase-like Zn-dependent oxidoreductase
MNAAVVTSFSAPPRYSTFADPQPSESELIVNITAAGLHQVVRALANGTHYGSTGQLPFIPGVDGTGRLEDGTRIYFGIARPPYGTFAEKAVAIKGMYITLPDGLGESTAAGIANPGMSSWAALKARAKFAAGENVLILGATGISGKLSVQIAKRFGARRIVAAGRNPQALEELKSLGADTTISLTQDHDALVSAFRNEIAENGVDVILDYLWGAPAEAALAAIAQKGLKHASARIRFIQIGNSAAPTISLPAATLRSSGLELLGSGFGSASMDEIFQAVREFFEVAAKTPFQVSLKTIPLSDIASVWSTPERGARIVFQP